MKVLYFIAAAASPNLTSMLHCHDKNPSHIHFIHEKAGVLSHLGQPKGNESNSTNFNEQWWLH